MSNFFSDLDWKELFLPVISDLRNINRETNTSAISTNNLNLANQDNEEEYEKIITEINKSREIENSGHNLIIIE
ncbi:hypothetical protein NHF50_05225 [Flavobacterium sp. NRK F10]|uniref:hypothetical protein n=1 Tax=Flavobacterium sp. NRK F10 TaxID=2954931 RepID=UPI00209143A8|nr:hypothetical protein [Flavobacterium sp. NRK F10]MCO6174441.1 hypothetical protein [Flavobacterium sp. NRK F10]